MIKNKNTYTTQRLYMCNFSSCEKWFLCILIGFCKKKLITDLNNKCYCDKYLFLSNRGDCICFLVFIFLSTRFTNYVYMFIIEQWNTNNK